MVRATLPSLTSAIFVAKVPVVDRRDLSLIRFIELGGRTCRAAGDRRLATSAPKRILAVAVLVMIGTAIFGIPVIKSLSAGGMQNPASKSSQAATLLSEKFNQGDMDMLITVSSDGGSHTAQSAAEVG